MIKASTDSKPGVADEDGGKRRPGSRKLLSPIVLASFLIVAVGAVSWFLLYISNLNVGD